MASEELLFTVDLHGKDFLLRTGIPSHKLEEEVVKKITGCKAEYLPSEKGFLIPHGELCNLLDECFDYFTEQTLTDIANLLDKSDADQTTKERVREKSVSKSKAPKKRKEEARPLETIREKVAEHSKSSESSREDERRKEAERRNKELESRLLEIEKQREEDRQNALRLKASPIRFRSIDSKKNVNFVEPVRSLYHTSHSSRSGVHDLHPHHSSRSGVHSMDHSGVHDLHHHPHHSSRSGVHSMDHSGVHSVGHESHHSRSQRYLYGARGEEWKEEALGMMSHLRSSMKTMKDNMERLESLIEKHC